MHKTTSVIYRQRSNRCFQFFVNFDLEGQAFALKLPDGRDTYKTCIGGVCYILVSIVILLYAATTFAELLIRENYSLVTKEFTGANLDSTYNFGPSNGFAVAAAISGAGYDWGDGSEDASTGRLKFVLKSWNNPTDSVKFRELESRSCTAEDFKVEEGEFRSSYGFYEQDESV